MRGYVLGIDLGGTKIEAAVVDGRGRIIGRGRGKTEAWRSEEEVFDRIVRMARRAIESAEIDEHQLAALGVGTPGPLDPDTGYIIETANLPFRNFPLGPRLRETFGCPTAIQNDVDAAIYGEFRAGAAQGAKHVLGMFVGTGIGGGLVLNGSLYNGFGKNAGEIGHMIIEARGPRCGCGRRGCLEALASRTAITRDLRKAIKNGQKTMLTRSYGKNLDELPSRALREAFDANDKLVKRIVRRAARHLGIGLGSLVNVLSPQIIVLGGGVIEAVGDEILDIIYKWTRRTAFEFSMKGVKLVKSRLGDDAGVMGAAIIAHEALEARQQVTHRTRRRSR
ncbi:MAG TPA: ROK family protein [Blastocatellia bacterium]|nr:ROK family protein [Blastocatellia bacterium]